jgi:acyl-CoA synthetase (AMP-forming)/AMP-acid ligase II
MIQSMSEDPMSEVSTLVELLRIRGNQDAGRLAFTFLKDGEHEESRLTYGELDQSAQRIAARLQAMGLEGERVLLLYPSGLEFIAAFFGCLYAGAIAIPASAPRNLRALQHLRSITDDAQPKLVLTSEGVWARVEPLLSQTGLDSLRWLTDQSLNSMTAGEWHEPQIDGDTLAFLQYTSGSTSEPKGVMVAHRNVLANNRMLRESFGQDEDSVVVSWLPLFHDMGLVGNVLQVIYQGAQCVLMPPEAFLMKPVRWLQAISRYGAQNSGGPNFAYELCARRVTAEQKASLDLSKWEVAFIGAEPVRAGTLERFAEAFSSCGFRGAALYPCYGLAEASLFVAGESKLKGYQAIDFQARSLEEHCAVPCADADVGALKARRLVGCGHGWVGQEISIVDPASSFLCESGRVGEVWVSGPNVAQGYWGRGGDSQETFRAHVIGDGATTYLRTGDLGFFYDGKLFICGRFKDHIIIAGRNHYPADIEQAVEQCHHAIRTGACAAFSVEVDDFERLVVVAELERTYREDDRSVVQAIRQAVAEAHDLMPHSITLLNPTGCPRTSSGKIIRHACRTSWLDGTLNIWKPRR